MYGVRQSEKGVDVENTDYKEKINYVHVPEYNPASPRLPFVWESESWNACDWFSLIIKGRHGDLEYN